MCPETDPPLFLASRMNKRGWREGEEARIQCGRWRRKKKKKKKREREKKKKSMSQIRDNVSFIAKLLHCIARAR